MGLNRPLRGPKFLKIRPQGYFFIPRRLVRSPGPPWPLKHLKIQKNYNLFYILGGGRRAPLGSSNYVFKKQLKCFDLTSTGTVPVDSLESTLSIVIIIISSTQIAYSYIFKFILIGSTTQKFFH